jgi:hypothetical protein
MEALILVAPQRAPVGIEPANEGFAVLGELLQGFIAFPKLLYDWVLAHLHTTAHSQPFASFFGKTFPRPSHRLNHASRIPATCYHLREFVLPDAGV